MKRLFMSLAMFSLVSLIGCGSSNSGTSNKVGGPGAKDASDRSGSVLHQPENTFSLSTPTLATSIKQGEAKDVKISISRGTNFDQDVSLKFDDVPKGVTIDPSSTTIKKGDKDVTVSVKAADDAALGEHVIKVTGKPSSGPEASNTFKIDIKKK